jgi:N-methylhydantoinase A
MQCDGADLDQLNARFAELEAEGLGRLRQEGFPQSDVELVRVAGMRYVGQSYEVDTPIPAGTLDADAVAQIKRDFNVVHAREHGVSSEEFAIAFVNLRVTAIGKVEKPDPRKSFSQSNGSENGGGGSARKGTRRVYFDGAFVESTVYDGVRLTADVELEGPAIIEYADAEIVVPPRMNVRTDDASNVILTAAAV